MRLELMAGEWLDALLASVFRLFIGVVSISLLWSHIPEASARAQNSKINPEHTKEQIADAALSESELLQRANKAFYAGDYEQARKQCLLLKALEERKTSDARLFANIAICDAQLDNWQDAHKNAKNSLQIAEENSLTRSDALVILARYYIVTRQINKARSAYKEALELSELNLGEWNCDAANIYAGLAACEYDSGNLEEAARLYKRVSQLDYLNFGSDDPRVAWGLLSLSNVLHELGDCEQAAELYRKVFWNFRKQNESRIIDELKPDAKERKQFVEELRKQLYGFTGAYDHRSAAVDYLVSDIPEELKNNPTVRLRNIDNWFSPRAGREQAPGLAFFNPRRKLEALLFTVHGLGLHHGSYRPFAEFVQEEGLGVVSFDVRGFGTYRNDELLQRVDFKLIIEDLKRILTALRVDYPGLPIFIVGESMGGAIALRIASVAPDLVDGVVSSVPSGTRFHGKSTAMKVAVRFLSNKYGKFNIGEQVVAQATQDPDLRHQWGDNPKARMKFSAVDLLNFQRFMNANMKHAARIEDIPVIIIQGYSDQLVKPLSTLALYQAIGSKDKNLTFLGDQEHLILEEGQFNKDVVEALVSWIKKRISRLEACED